MKSVSLIFQFISSGHSLSDIFFAFVGAQSMLFEGN